MPSSPHRLLPAKRSLSNDSARQSINKYAPASKKSRRRSNDAHPHLNYEQRATATRPRSTGLADTEARPARPLPSASMADAAGEMLNRGEQTGSMRPGKLARVVAENVSPAPSVSRPISRQASDAVDGQRPRRRHSDEKTYTTSHLLRNVNATELLQMDPRPSLIIDLGDDTNYSSSTLHPVFVNHALRTRPHILAHLLDRSDDPTQMLDIATPFAEFKSWVLTRTDEELGTEANAAFEYGGTIWRSLVMRKRLKVISGDATPLTMSEQEVKHRPSLQRYQGLSSSASELPVKLSKSTGYFQHRNVHTIPDRLQSLVTNDPIAEALPLRRESPPVSNGDKAIADLIADPFSPLSEQKIFPVRNNPEAFEPMTSGALSDGAFFDWTRLPLSDTLPAHVQFTRSINWAVTSLGPIESWPPDLRAMCNLIMASPHPAAMYWGKDHVAIYNEAYILLAGQKHPSLMGMRYKDAWAEIWSALEDVFHNAHTHAQATMKDDDCLMIQRNGFLEETYFSWSLIPLIGEDGTVVGTYNPAFEKTRRKIAERRMLTLREIGEKTAAARKVSQFWRLLLEGLEYNELDAPLVLIYALQDEMPDSDAGSVSSSTLLSSKVCVLEGALGVTAGHPAAPTQIDLKSGKTGFAVAFRHCLIKNKPIVLRAEDGSLDMSLLDGVRWRGFGDPSQVVVVSPIQPTSGESTLGFLVMATNPRRPYDEDYDLFVQLLGRQLATSIASVVLFEEEIRKAEEAAKMAAQDHIELSNKLLVQTQQVADSEKKFTRLAEVVPVGIYIGDEKGNIVFCNDAWYDISSYPRGQPIGNAWLDWVVEADREKAAKCFEKLMTQGVPVSIEFRYKTPWKDNSGNTSDTWVLATGYPEKDEDGRVRRTFGSVTNITSQKFAEAVQKRRTEEAVEMKRQQTNFIDITSHEMRNPLGAILLSADEIVASLTQFKNSQQLTDEQISVLSDDIEAAQIITLCARHQKRIVDDVLTLSKLDSAVLLVTPVDAQPLAVVKRALKPFQAELQSADVGLDFRIDQSYYDSDVDWVRLDPFRLSQVLINLTTNAIKFTTTQEKRTILVHIGASKEKPSSEDRYGLTYIPTRTLKTKDITAGPDWGMGETVYIHFAVQDTGRGLNEEEKEKLFQRFSQANPRTHVAYGGSGLGLFICRELVELQGGEIGVASESGKGSTFAFYVKGRRSQAPPRTLEEAGDFWHQSSRKSSAKESGRSSQSHAQSSLSKSTSAPNDDLSSQDTILSATLHIAGPQSAASAAIRPTDLKILIVEDNLINQKVLASQLRKLGCTVYVANHGGEALEHIARSTFHRDHAPAFPRGANSSANGTPLSARPRLPHRPSSPHSPTSPTVNPTLTASPNPLFAFPVPPPHHHHHIIRTRRRRSTPRNLHRPDGPGNARDGRHDLRPHHPRDAGFRPPGAARPARGGDGERARGTGGGMLRGRDGRRGE